MAHVVRPGGVAVGPRVDAAAVEEDTEPGFAIDFRTGLGRGPAVRGDVVEVHVAIIGRLRPTYKKISMRRC